MPNFIELRGIYKSYAQLPAPVLDGLNLKISRGERLVILGASGSGKTTLLHLLGLLLRPERGSVLIDENDAQLWGEKARANWRNKNLGYVFQDFGLIPELTIAENIELPLRIAGQRNIGAAGEKLLQQVGLSGREKSFPNEVSGGECQRVAIARALVGNPSLVLADEPTGNLQRRQGAEIARLFGRLQEKLGFSLVVATHNEELAGALDASVLRLASGKLYVEKGATK